MRELVLTENITLDGVIDAREGWFAPSGEEGVDQSDIEAVLGEEMAAQDALLMGRITFEEMRGYWPMQADDTTGVTDHLNSVTKYVVSTEMEDPEWDNTVLVRPPVEAAVSELKSSPGGEIGVTGSLTLVPALIAADLIDEYRLFVYPVVLGKGARLFPDGVTRPKLELAEARSFNSGIALLRYRVVRS